MTARTADAEPPRCELCGRDRPLTQHHLIPRYVHSKRRYSKKYSKQEMRTRLLMLCRECHSGIHQLYSERDLAEQFHSRELLLKDPRVQKMIRWARKKK